VANGPSKRTLIVVHPVQSFNSDGESLRIGRADAIPTFSSRRSEIEAENHDSARSAAREGFASAVQLQLQGGFAAVLTPERRRRLVAGAGRVGLSPFEANLVIALVQHDSRSRDRAGPTPQDQSARPGLRRGQGALWAAAAAAALGAAMFMGVRAWLIG